MEKKADYGFPNVKRMESSYAMSPVSMHVMSHFFINLKMKLSDVIVYQEIGPTHATNHSSHSIHGRQKPLKFNYY
jgi:hypothetical protein